MFRFIEFCYFMFDWYFWEGCCFLKGIGGLVDLKVRGYGRCLEGGVVINGIYCMREELKKKNSNNREKKKESIYKLF